MQETGDPLGAAAVAATFGSDNPSNLLEDNQADDDDASTTEAQSLSRGQRKRLKRRAAFMHKMGMVSRVAQEQQKETETQTHGVFADLDELQTSLFQAEEDTEKKKGKGLADRKSKKKALSGRQRQKLAVRELGQLKAVQTHSGFQTDPFAAIQVHLLNTVVQANQELLQKTEAKQKRGGFEHGRRGGLDCRACKYIS
uniref:Ribosome biogenesis protein SLX9 n=1 Tax=Hyaloperonospora arabidopsidis (strain Emoy2) TaxID=559515 RepID=M4C6M0_HYAAE